VNIRYGPYCVYRGLEKHLVGISGVLFDPYEWRTDVRNPFMVLANNNQESLQFERNELPLNNKIFTAKCEKCAIKSICDGIDKNYYEVYGDSELVPYEGKAIADIVHFRRDNVSPFMLKQKIGNDGQPLVPKQDAQGKVNGTLTGDMDLIVTGIRKFYEKKFHQRHYLAETPMRISKK